MKEWHSTRAVGSAWLAVKRTIVPGVTTVSMPKDWIISVPSSQRWEHPNALFLHGRAAKMMLINTLHNWSGSDNQNLRVWQVGQGLVQISQDRDDGVNPIILVWEERSLREKHLVIGEQPWRWPKLLRWWGYPEIFIRLAE